MQESVELIRARVVQYYGVPREQVAVVVAPYRICPLGAHIDHQRGRVTAMALDRGVLLAFAPSDAPVVRVRSLDFPGEIAVHLADDVPPRQGDWGDYVRGAARVVRDEWPGQRGFVGITAGRVAEGGLSSSAAVCVAYLLALQQVNQIQVTAVKNIELAQQIENRYLGLQIGILDPSAILLSRANALTVIDCDNVAYELIERPAGTRCFDILIASSGLRKSLVQTDYNRRVEECAAAARQLLAAAGRPQALPHLRRVTVEEYQQYGRCLKGAAARRAAHFFSEMQRVACGAEAWSQGDLNAFGQLISESGASSIHNYQCGAPPLIDLYHILVKAPGVLGARFSGAGFRGCCLALVDSDHAEQAVRYVSDCYTRQHADLAREAWTMLCQPADGARVEV